MHLHQSHDYKGTHAHALIGNHPLALGDTVAAAQNGMGQSTLEDRICGPINAEIPGKLT